ncbi:hypothetical protein KAFR_0L01180 [Kazachstania africana CBS 2517]|uniref:HIT domain-containing protein n=1 Tax=Kazachstania africana (strain ATCC 22294 / BCRC 22015 / CBS 2517 / CECT 1963 / NBRC 1671 / NRRL Y-8276) TaxID=1071382 RepID=H2B276_KAZAF|nr:hypothetical protein KAFR_0L01180 [Kazachstania africana CBS 2517]CCF60726.1 hypothetical protein KAFR_0L01180 [Kazachstania africana CBS 2517]
MSPNTEIKHYNSDCLFCKIISGEIPSYRLIETQYSFSFLDTQPTSHGHILIVPKYHSPRLHNVPDQYLTDLLPVAKRFAKALKLDEKDTGYNILQNNTQIASQSVDHVHVHFIPKHDVKTGLIITWPSKDAERNDLMELRDQIMHNLQSP